MPTLDNPEEKEEDILEVDTTPEPIEPETQPIEGVGIEDIDGMFKSIESVPTHNPRKFGEQKVHYESGGVYRIYEFIKNAWKKVFDSEDYTDLTDSGATTLHKHDHGNLDGLNGDDHSQYHNDTRGDARYLYRENEGVFTPNADYEPATKKYVDDNVVAKGTAIYGDGSDGDVDINTGSFSSGPISSNALTRDAYFDNLTLSGGNLNTAGYRLFVKGILTINSSYKITRNGGVGGTGGNGSVGSAGDYDGGGEGGTGGSGGTLAAGTLYGAIDGQDGVAGVAGAANVTGENNGTNGNEGATGSNGTSVAQSLGVAGKDSTLGGTIGEITGGKGSGGSTTSGGVVGAGNAGNKDGGDVTVPNTKPNCVQLATIMYELGGTEKLKTSANSTTNGGSGGSGGGGRTSANDWGAGGGGAGGIGGNGGQGGVIILVYNTKTGSGNLVVTGGAAGSGGTRGTGGANTGTGFADYSGSGGGSGGNGGAGSSGGIILIIAKTIVLNGDIEAKGGAGGGGGLGAAGGVAGDIEVHTNDPGEDGDDGIAGLSGNNGSTPIEIIN